MLMVSLFIKLQTVKNQINKAKKLTFLVPKRGEMS